jgi:hypothetical protein
MLLIVANLRTLPWQFRQKRNTIVEGVISTIRFLNDMVAFYQSMYVLFAETASPLAS